MSWYALRNAAKLKTSILRRGEALASTIMHILQSSVALGKPHVAAFNLFELALACLTRMCIIWQQARQQAASTTDSAASCLALPVCIALRRWEAQFITSRCQVLIPISYY